MEQVLFFTCEHAGNDVPVEFEELFFEKRKLLDSHFGYDPGAMYLAQYLSRSFQAPLHTSHVTRLLVDTNRSMHNQSLHADFIWPLVSQVREKIIRQYYTPYRSLVEKEIQKLQKSGKQVIHISVHSFTEIFHGNKREGDIGVLFDPSRETESAFSQDWIHQMKSLNTYDVRDNYPYQGIDDGFTTYLRNKYSNYMGIEVEVKQSLLLKNFSEVSTLVEKSLKKTWENVLRGPVSSSY